MDFRADTPHETLIQIVKEKHEQIPEIMKETGIDCWIVFMRETAANPDPVQNLVVGGDVVWESAFIFSISNGEFTKTCVIGNFDADAEKEKGLWTEVIPYTQGISEVLLKTIEKLNPNKIGLNYSQDDVVADGLSHGMYLKISKYLDTFKDRFVSAQAIISKVRARKTITEVELVRQACVLTEEINNKIQAKFKLGMSEQEIQNMFHQEMNDQGVIEAWQRVSCPAVDAGPDKVMGHIGPTDLPIRRGHSLHNDFGVQLHGYCSDIQRMWFFGNKDELPEELRHAFDTVHGAISAAAEFIKPGVKGVEADAEARNHVISRGYEEYQHALGHQVGTKAHDGGALLGPMWERYGDLPQGLLEKGNIFTLELYVKTKNFGMVSLEEDILVTADGCEFLVPRQNDWIYVN